MKVVVPVPSCVTLPVPLIGAAKPAAFDRSMTSAALSTMGPFTMPVVPPLPSCSVPALMVVVPVIAWSRVSVSLPAPVFSMPPVPESRPV